MSRAAPGVSTSGLVAFWIEFIIAVISDCLNCLDWLFTRKELVLI